MAFDDLVAALRLPLIAAPMTGVSGYDLVAAATAAGIGGSFPVHNCQGTDVLDNWLQRLARRDQRLDRPFGPVIPNLVVHRSNASLGAEVEVLVQHRVTAVITSVGSPAAVVEPLQDAGITVLSDVASLRHAHRAIEAGVDGLVLLACGGGGQTGWANPLAFVRAVRSVWDGPLVLAGGVVDGPTLLAAQVAGYDLAYMGTAFIATWESEAAASYKAAVVAATLDDITVTDELTGLPVSIIRNGVAPSIPQQAGEFSVEVLQKGVAAVEARSLFSAGHSVAGVDAVRSVEQLVVSVEAGWLGARAAFGQP